MLFLLSLIARALARLVASSADDGSKDIEILVLRHQLKVLADRSAVRGFARWTGRFSPLRPERFRETVGHR